MRLTFVLLTAAFLQVGATGTSQTVTVSGNNMKLEKVFGIITEQTGYNFLYPQDLIDPIFLQKISAENVPLKDFLNLIFKDVSLKYAIKKKNIIVTPSPPVFKDPALANDPPVDIQGKVVDEQGKAIPDVSVAVKGAKRRL